MSEVATNYPEKSPVANPDESIETELQDILNQAHFARRAEEIAKHIELTPDVVAQTFGYDSETAQGAINDSELIRPDVRIAHRISMANFQSFLQDGRLKSYQETGYSSGSDGEVSRHDGADYVRRNYENAHDLRRDDEPTIIHGYLEDMGTLGERGQAFSYGPVEVILKEEVIQRSVFTNGDSIRTQSNPIDFDTALVTKCGRDRIRQRANDHRNGDWYTEAIILGGVTLQDVEGIVIDITEQQNNQEYDIENQILNIQRALPDARIGFKIPAETYFPTKQIIELAKKYPNVDFMATIRGGLDQDIQSPFRATSTPEREQLAGKDSMQQSQEAAKLSYETGTKRRDHLQARLQERWVAMGNAGEPPTNISFHLTNNRY